MPDCTDCGRPIGFVKRWWDEPTAGYSSVWVVCDLEPDDDAPETYVEVEKNDAFAVVFRHRCEGRPKQPEPNYLHKRIFPKKEDLNG